MVRVGGTTNDDADDDPLAPVDDYEETIDEVTAFRLCGDDGCREPRRGPFVIDLGEDDAVVRCYRCFAANVLYIDPDEVDA